MVGYTIGDKTRTLQLLTHLYNTFIEELLVFGTNGNRMRMFMKHRMNKYLM